MSHCLKRKSGEMQLLWIVPYPPFTTFGGGVRVYNLMKVLAATCKIDLLALSDGPRGATDMPEQLRSICRRGRKSEAVTRGKVS